MSGERRLTLTGHIVDTDCNSLPCAEIEVWGADPGGRYSFAPPYWGRGRLTANADGYYRLVTWSPGAYNPRPEHIHFAITTPGAPSFVTQMYIASDPRAAGVRETQKAHATVDPDGPGALDLMAEWNIVLPPAFVRPAG